MKEKKQSPFLLLCTQHGSFRLSVSSLHTAVASTLGILHSYVVLLAPGAVFLEMAWVPPAEGSVPQDCFSL